MGYKYINEDSLYWFLFKKDLLYIKNQIVNLYRVSEKMHDDNILISASYYSEKMEKINSKIDSFNSHYSFNKENKYTQKIFESLKDLPFKIRFYEGFSHLFKKITNCWYCNK